MRENNRASHSQRIQAAYDNAEYPMAQRSYYKW